MFRAEDRLEHEKVFQRGGARAETPRNAELALDAPNSDGLAWRRQILEPLGEFLAGAMRHESGQRREAKAMQHAGSGGQRKPCNKKAGRSATVIFFDMFSAASASNWSRMPSDKRMPCKALPSAMDCQDLSATRMKRTWIDKANFRRSTAMPSSAFKTARLQPNSHDKK